MCKIKKAGNYLLSFLCYIKIGDIMNNIFEKGEKYRLYRTVKEIFHPTISKKNISNYKIIVKENLLPLRIFYPEKVTNMENVIIYIPGDVTLTKCNEKYSDISSLFALKTNNLVITIDISDNNKTSNKKYLNNIYEVIKYLYFELLNLNIKNITLLGDSTGATTILKLCKKLEEENISINKQILFYPMIIDKFMTKKSKSEKERFLNKLIIIGDKDDNYNELKLLSNKLFIINNMKHGFLKEENITLTNNYIDAMNEYLKG